MAAEFDYDLVILDLNLPRLDGISILRNVRTCKPSMPVLVLTAWSQVEDRIQFLDMGADDYLVKPFSSLSFRPAFALCCGAATCRRCLC